MQALAITTIAVATLAGIGAQNATRALQSRATCLAPEYHFDFPGYDLVSVPGASFDTCCDACFEVRSCSAFTWTNYNGGTCWLKGARGSSEWKGANADGSAHTASAEINRCGKPAVKDQDLIGVEGGSFPGKHPESCCMRCLEYKGCKGIAWNDYNGGTCYFKGGDIRTVSKPGVYSIVFDR